MAKQPEVPRTEAERKSAAAQALEEAHQHMVQAEFAVNRASALVEGPVIPTDPFESGVLHALRMQMTSLMTEMSRCAGRMMPNRKEG